MTQQISQGCSNLTSTTPSSVVRIVLLCLRLRLRAQWMYCNSQHSRSRRTWGPLPEVHQCSRRLALHFSHISPLVKGRRMRGRRAKRAAFRCGFQCQADWLQRPHARAQPRGLAQERWLGNYPFLTPCVEIKKANLYGVSTGAILGRFSNAAAVNVTRSTNGLLGSAPNGPTSG